MHSSLNRLPLSHINHPTHIGLGNVDTPANPSSPDPTVLSTLLINVLELSLLLYGQALALHSHRKFGFCLLLQLAAFICIIDRRPNLELTIHRMLTTVQSTSMLPNRREVFKYVSNNHNIHPIIVYVSLIFYFKAYLIGELMNSCKSST